MVITSDNHPKITGEAAPYKPGKFRVMKEETWRKNKMQAFGVSNRVGYNSDGFYKREVYSLIQKL